MALGLDQLKALARRAGANDAEAEAIYQQIVADVDGHFAKHLEAEKVDHPERTAEIALLEAVVQRTRDEPISLTAAINDALNPPQEPRRG